MHFYYIRAMLKVVKMRIIQIKIVIQIIIVSLLFMVSNSCKDDQSSFVPYVKVSKYISLANYNDLYIPGNSVTFPGIGYSGLVVICISQQQYYAFDACCPYEGLKSCFVELEPGKTGEIKSSNWTATCKCCGSQYTISGGYPIKGPSGRNLKQYQVSVLSDRLWVHN
jgi:nitrite reductase/ring-hydroxylating ferredoxin subunit